MLATLLVVSLVHFVTAASFVIVARTLVRRLPEGQERGAALAFALWWAALGGYVLMEGLWALVGAFGTVPVSVYLVTRVLSVPLLVGAMWGLVYYLGYLFTGRSGLAVPLALFYGGVGVLFYYAVFTGPLVMNESAWLVRLAGTGEGMPYTIVYLAVGLPAILGSLAYGSLALRLKVPMQRYRVALVSTAILAWVASGLVAQLGASDLLKFVTVVPFGLGASVIVLLAYHPPRWVLARLGDNGRSKGTPAPTGSSRRSDRPRCSPRSEPAGPKAPARRSGRLANLAWVSARRPTLPAGT